MKMKILHRCLPIIKNNSNKQTKKKQKKFIYTYKNKIIK